MKGIAALKGLVLDSVDQTYSEQLVFKTRCGRSFMMYHESECCESVSIESITGDLSDLIGHPILMAEEVTSSNGGKPEGADQASVAQFILENSEVREKGDESFTWTFYKLATIKGYVDIRWYGSSNGYYSESVDFVETTKN